MSETSSLSTQQSDLFHQAEARRDAGITSATAHAENEHPDWNDQAYRLLLQYVMLRNGRSFLSEEFVAWAQARIAAPPDPRAWGGPIKRAAMKGHIKRVGYAPADSSNRSPKCVWQGP